MVINVGNCYTFSIFQLYRVNNELRYAGDEETSWLYNKKDAERELRKKLGILSLGIIFNRKYAHFKLLILRFHQYTIYSQFDIL